MNQTGAIPRTWPVSPRPMPYETVRSYISRLARANHLQVSDFYTEVIGFRGSAQRELLLNPEAQRRLAHVSGRPLPELRRALPSLATDFEVGDPMPGARGLIRAAQAITPACTRCTAQHGGPTQAQLIPPEHINMCHQHHQWLRKTAEPLDTSNRPEIARAQHQHLHLARHRPHQLPAALNLAYTLVSLWSEDHRVLHHRAHSRNVAITTHNQLTLGEAPWEISTYPELIAMAGVLAGHPDWPPDPPDWTIFPHPPDPRIIQITAALFARLHIPFDPSARQNEIYAVAYRTRGPAIQEQATEARRCKAARWANIEPQSAIDDEFADLTWLKPFILPPTADPSGTDIAHQASIRDTATSTTSGYGSSNTSTLSSCARNWPEPS